MLQKQCNKCGLVIEESGNFCPKCGSNDFSSLNIDEPTINEKDLQTGESFDSLIVSSNGESTIKKNNGLKVGLIASGIVLPLVVVIIAIAFGGDANDKKIPQDSTVSSITNNTEENYEQEIFDYIEQSKKHANNGEFEEALAILDTTEQLYGTDSRIDEQRKNVNIQKGLKELSVIEEEEKYGECIQYIDKYLSEYKTESDILGKRNLYVSKYKAQVIANADNALKSNGYNSAMGIIDDALKVLPTEQELLNKQTEYEEYKPVDLFSLDYFNAADNFGFEYNDPQERKDNEGNTYGKTYCFKPSYYSSNTWVEYKLDKKYNKLLGTFFLDFDWRTTKQEAHFYVYGDGKLLYDGGQTGGKVPFDFDVDITNVDVLRIEYKTSIWTTSGFTHSVFAGIFDNTYIVKAK